MSKNPTSFDTTFETYEVDGVLGEGGAGRVFAVHGRGGDTFALKLLRPEGVSSERRSRFKNEISFCSKTDCPNIVRVLDEGFTIISDKKCPFYVMRRYDRTLGAVIGSIQPDDVLPLFSQILDGVEVAHLQGVWHRDLKPENVLLEEGIAAVADFGIAHFSDAMLETAVETKDSSRLANFVYAAPEQKMPGAEVDARADIFALGLLLNQLFTGEVPHGVDFKKIEKFAPGYAYLDEVVVSMLQQDPDARIRTIDEVKRSMMKFENQFIARQELREADGRVVRRHEPDVVQPIEVVGIDYNDGLLMLSLSRRPELDWIEAFRTGGGFKYIPGIIEPSLFEFTGDGATIRTTERLAQEAINMFKDYIEKATASCRSRRESAAQILLQQESEQLKQQQEKASERERILGKLEI